MRWLHEGLGGKCEIFSVGDITAQGSLKEYNALRIH